MPILDNAINRITSPGVATLMMLLKPDKRKKNDPLKTLVPPAALRERNQKPKETNRTKDPS